MDPTTDPHQELARIIRENAPSFEYFSPRDNSEYVEFISSVAYVVLEDAGILEGRTQHEIEERIKKEGQHSLRKNLTPPMPGTEDADELSISVYPRGNPNEDFSKTPTTLFGAVKAPIFESKKRRPSSDESAKQLFSMVDTLDQVPAYYLRLHHAGFCMGQAGLRLHFEDYKKPKAIYKGVITFSKDNQTIEELIKALQFLNRFPKK